jgi:hypothetical protein
MPYVKDLAVPKRRAVNVRLSADEAARLLHGNKIHRALEAKARAKAGRRILTGVYTSSQTQDGFMATFETATA